MLMKPLIQKKHSVDSNSEPFPDRYVILNKKNVISQVIYSLRPSEITVGVKMYNATHGLLLILDLLIM